MTPRPRAGIDLDGCLYDWESNCRAMVAQYTGKLLPVSNSFNFIMENVPGSVWEWLWRPEQTQRMFGDGQGYGDGVAAVKLIAETHDLVVLTRRPRVASVVTLNWLAEQRLPVTEFHLISARGIKKSEVECDWYIDDNPLDIDDLVVREAEGKRVFLLDRPWNQMQKKGIRVMGWPELVKELMKEGQ